jgi:hypothetical protein
MRAFRKSGCSVRYECIVSLTQYYTATSVDGFIADADNSLDWLFTRKREDDGPLNYGEFIADVGAMACRSSPMRGDETATSPARSSPSCAHSPDALSQGPRSTTLLMFLTATLRL